MPELTDQELRTYMGLSEAQFFGDLNMSLLTPEEEMQEDIAFFNKYYAPDEEE